MNEMQNTLANSKFGSIKIGAVFIWCDRDWYKLDNNWARLSGHRNRQPIVERQFQEGQQILVFTG